MKIEFTKIGLKELNRVQNKFEDVDDYYGLTENEQHIMDMMLYVEEGYGENEFETLNEFANEVAEIEYKDPIEGVILIVNKITTMINQGIIVLN